MVTLAELKAHLRIQHDWEDTLLSSLIAQAQAAALDYCHLTAFEGEPEPVRLAIMLFASHFYEVRDNSDKTAYETMMTAFHALLYPYRNLDKFF
ncbi:MAG: phage gp6-like head-tail connector protein [Clostridia bacterium]|nr:phage gp6-like head-tail connector protein [Clostridia bacterium]